MGAAGASDDYGEAESDGESGKDSNTLNELMKLQKGAEATGIS